jgi:3-oxoacyl-[acyl-carrier protein] reductase
MMNLAGKTALVTGASSGIGASIAEELAACGASVTVNYFRNEAGARAVAAKIEAAGQQALVVRADVRRKSEVSRLVAEHLQRFGRIDILVNNAGIAGKNATTWEYPAEEWRQVMRVNLDGPFHCCRALAPGMIAQGYGRIVNIASVAGKEGNPNASAYSVSKAGVIALTKSLGKELASYDIAVNAITPAAAKTAIFDQMTKEHIDFMLSKIPRARFVKIEEIAALAAWCASADNSFTTGAVFDISGGRATY